MEGPDNDEYYSSLQNFSHDVDEAVWGWSSESDKDSSTDREGEET